MGLAVAREEARGRQRARVPQEVGAWGAVPAGGYCQALMGGGVLTHRCKHSPDAQTTDEGPPVHTWTLAHAPTLLTQPRLSPAVHLFLATSLNILIS